MSIPTADAPTDRVLAHQLLDDHGRVLSHAEPERPFYAASTIKLHVVLTVLQAAADGRLDLDAMVPATRTFTGADRSPFTLYGDHLDPSHPADDTPVAIRELVVRAIDRSSNEATDHLLELVGLDAVARSITELGLTRTCVQRLIGDGAALEQGLTNETTAADLATTMRALVNPEPTPESGEHRGVDAHREVVVDALRNQQIPIITTVLKDGIDHGSKSGWVDGFRHDVAFLGAPGEELRVLAVMTSGMGESEGDREIRDLSRQLLPTAMLAD